MAWMPDGSGAVTSLSQISFRAPRASVCCWEVTRVTLYPGLPSSSAVLFINHPCLCPHPRWALGKDVKFLRTLECGWSGSFLVEGGCGVGGRGLCSPRPVLVHRTVLVPHVHRNPHQAHSVCIFGLARCSDFLDLPHFCQLVDDILQAT